MVEVRHTTTFQVDHLTFNCFDNNKGSPNDQPLIAIGQYPSYIVWSLVSIKADQKNRSDGAKLAIIYLHAIKMDLPRNCFLFTLLTQHVHSFNLCTCLHRLSTCSRLKHIEELRFFFMDKLQHTLYIYCHLTNLLLLSLLLQSLSANTASRDRSQKYWSEHPQSNKL